LNIIEVFSKTKLKYIEHYQSILKNKIKVFWSLFSAKNWKYL